MFTMAALSSLLAACLLAAPTAVLSAPTNATVETPTGSLNSTNTTTNATYLDAPYGGKVWVVDKGELSSRTFEVLALWEEVKNATHYRFCHESPNFMRRCTLLSENKFNIGSTLSIVTGSEPEKILWTVRAEADNTTSEWATVSLQNSSTIGEYNSTLTQYCGGNDTENDEFIEWTATAKASELAVGNATSAVIDATWGATVQSSAEAFKPEGGYEVCVEIQGLQDPSDGGELYTYDCQIYPSDTTLKNLRVNNVSTTAKTAYVHVAGVNVCSKRQQATSDPVEVRQLFMALNYSIPNEDNLCVGKSINNAGKDVGIPAVGINCFDNPSMLWQFYYVNSNDRVAEEGFRLRAKIETGEIYCLSGNYAGVPGKYGFAECSGDLTEKTQLFMTETARVQNEGNSRSRGITCIVPLTESGKEKAQSLLFDFNAELALGDCVEKKTSWEFELV